MGGSRSSPGAQEALEERQEDAQQHSHRDSNDDGEVGRQCKLAPWRSGHLPSATTNTHHFHQPMCVPYTNPRRTEHCHAAFVGNRLHRAVLRDGCCEACLPYICATSVSRQVWRAHWVGNKGVPEQHACSL